MQVKNGQVFDLRAGFIARDLNTDGALIARSSGDSAVLDAAGCYVIPGLVDVHFHGCAGADLSDADPEGLQTICDYQLSVGVPYLCPAGMTLPEAQLMDICRTAKQHKERASSGAELVGLHLEGPFLSYEKRGAQNAEYLHDPDGDLLLCLQEAAGGLVKLVTVAPEQPEALQFIEQARAAGIAVSVGHTACDYDIAREAFDAGARQVTHLYNGMEPLHHRKPGIIGAAFDRPEVQVELICDGVHIHESVVRLTFGLYGAERVILVSDSLRACGMPDGRYLLGGQDILVAGSRAVLAELPDTLAGSCANLMDCLRTAVRFGIPVADAVRAAGYNPARAIGLDDRLGTLDPGKDATFALLDMETLELKALVFKGERVL